MNMDDYNLLNEVTSLWGIVQRENFHDRELVTESEWREWKRYDDAVTKELNSIIDNFVKHLSEKDISYLNNLKARVAEAKRLTTEELEARSSEAHEELTRKLRGNLLPPEAS